MAAITPLIVARLEGEEQPQALVADEVFLAAACALGDRTALGIFERTYFGVIPAALSRLSLNRDEISEVEQQLRIRLFVAEGAETPRVVAYAGQGQLGGLVRVAAVRAGLSLLRERGRLASGAGGMVTSSRTSPSARTTPSSRGSRRSTAPSSRLPSSRRSCHSSRASAASSDSRS